MKVYGILKSFLTGQSRRIRQLSLGKMFQLKTILLSCFPDIAVGEPYGGPDGKGRVYIFNGNSTGLVLQPSEVSEWIKNFDGITDLNS